MEPPCQLTFKTTFMEKASIFDGEIMVYASSITQNPNEKSYMIKQKNVSMVRSDMDIGEENSVHREQDRKHICV